MRLTLVAIHTGPSPQAVPLANAFLAAFLASRPVLAGKLAITLCDCYCCQPPAEAAAAIAATKPDLVGFSLYLWNRGQAEQIGRLLLQANPRLRLFAGGPEATADPGGVLAEAPYRFLICGEGELPLAAAIEALLAGREPIGIPGVMARGAAAQEFSPAPSIADLDQLPSPILAGLLPAGAYSGSLWQLSRGCSFSCDFCFDAKGGRGVRRFPLERLTAELAWFVHNRVSQVFVLDATFNQDLKRAKAILRLIRQHAPHIHFHFELRSEFIDRELAQLCSEITCSLQIGLQSADPRILARVQRVFNQEDFVSRVGLLNETGAVFGFDLIYGLPGDTLAGFKASLDFAVGLYPNHLDIFPLAVLPGTALAGRSAALQLDHLPVPPYTLRGSPTFPASDMDRARQLADACDIFYSRGKAVAWCNSVLTALRLKPAAFFAAFADWLAGRPAPDGENSEPDDHEIWQLQREFLAEIFGRRRAARLLPLAQDLVDYHHHYAAALLAVPPEPPSDRELSRWPLLELPWQLAASARLARFNYEVYDLLDAGEPDLREFAACFRPTGSWAAIYPRGGEVFTESLMEPFAQLLSRLDGTAPAGSCTAGLDVSPAEVVSFLEFAAAEGIIVLPAAS
jgi:hypothetical protein